MIKLRRSVQFWIILMLAIVVGNIGVFRFAYVAGAATAFTSGDILVYRVGDGRGLLAATGNPVFLDEYAPSGALVQSIPMPTVASGANHRLIASGTAPAEGFLTRSSDGQYVVLTGYDSPIPTPNLAGTSSSTVARVVGRVDANGDIDTTTALMDFADASSPHSVASPNGIDLWVGGADGGLRYTVLGLTTSTQVNSTIANIRGIGIFGDRLYVSYSSDTAARIATVGAGLPILSGRTVANAPGFPSSTGSPCGFFLSDLNPFAPGPDTLYVADEHIGITKYSLIKGRWVAKGTVGTALDNYRGLTGSVDGTTVTLYATRNGGGVNGGGELVSLHDASGYDGVLAGAPEVLATAPAGTAFRGVAFAPGVTHQPTLITSIGSKMSGISGGSGNIEPEGGTMKVDLGVIAFLMVTLMAVFASGKDRETMSKRVFLNEKGGGYEVRVTDPKDASAVVAVQEELRRAAEDQTKASTPAMQEHQQEIIFRFEQTNRGGRLRIETKSPDALRAIQEYLRSEMGRGKTAKGVTFSYVRNTSLVVVPVMVNEHGPFRFLLDTGASNSILSASVADGLRIRSGRSEILFSAGGNIPVTMRMIQVFQVGEARLKNAEIAVADFALLQTLEIDGILGGDYLRKFKVSIDYDKQVVQIEPLAGSSSMLIA